MKNTNRHNLTIDPMAKARKHSDFSKYSKEARARILLAAEIYNARLEKGFSQQKLAEKINSTQKEISKIENGQINVGLDTIFKIIQSLGLKFQVGKTFLL
ncbi:MAG: helix-turn-helix transcriptional regulator [Candidatus Kuenenbacteria bacterium]